MATFKLTIEYDGTAYAGWQRQPDRPTVQASVEAAIQRVTQTAIPVIGAGRTDAGAHALGQVASFRSQKVMPAEGWVRALNALLPPDISVRSAERVADDFHARYSARGKLYEYRILNQAERSAMERTRAWHVRRPLDMESMREAASLLVGRHDFSSFQGHPTDTESPVCELRRLEISQQQTLIRFEAQADRFLKQMVRAIVGTLVEVGQGKRPPKSMKEILEARDRRAAGVTAPAHGLYLVRVDY
ncbi:MAG: tRNA pseudouridine(38-40) synthase TruA [Nitrospirae bacterium]|nr:tRNA pseudouridine(38-40) synthase TruA [Nitrospirota bacterium]